MLSKPRVVVTLAVVGGIVAAGWLTLRGPGVDEVPGLIDQLKAAAHREAFHAASEQLVAVGGDAVPLLLHALQYGDDETRPAVARFFGNLQVLQDAPPGFHSETVRKAIRSAARSTHWPTRAAAARGLVLHHHPVDPETARILLEIDSEREALSRRSEWRTDESETQALEDAQRAVNSFYLALSPRDGHLVPIFVAGLEDARRSARIFSVAALGFLGPTAASALPRLTEILDQEKSRAGAPPEAVSKRDLMRYDADMSLRLILQAIAKIRGEIPTHPF